MVLTSAIYLSFLMVLLVLYYFVPKKVQWIVLLIFSLLFIIYATNDFKLYACIVYVVLISYLGTNIIEKAKTEKQKKIVEVVTIILVLLQLISLKYLDFFVDIFKVKINIFSIIAPIGVSFYTLIAIGYVIDVYRKKASANKNIFKHILYILYFPQLTSGPITRYPEMEKELYSEHRFNLDNICFGFQRIIWGIFKKLVISERLAVVADTIFNNYTEFSGINIVIGAIAFSIQLYTDFSGCMDIVLGTSKMLDIKLPENFETPFFSKTIPEFWRRWHISLNEWFKDYLYIPLGGSRKGKIRTYINIMIIFIVSGLWHGAALTYIVWGLLNGIYNCLYRIADGVCKPLLDKIRKILGLNKERNTYKILQMLITSTLICFAFIFFRAETLNQAFTMVRNMLTKDFFIQIADLGLSNYDYIITGVGLAILFIVSILKQKYNILEQISKQHIAIRYIIWITLIVSILIFGYYGIGYDASSFLYQKF